MLPVSETDFVIKEINAKLSFVKGENGKVTKIKLNMNATDSELPNLNNFHRYCLFENSMQEHKEP